MSILVDKDTRALVQGITGRSGRFHTQRMLAYGTQIVAGVSPGKGGEEVDGVPVFNTVKEAVRSTGATSSVLLVPPPFAADAMMEAADSNIGLCVAITDGIPAQDMIRVKRYMRRYRVEDSMRLLGPNCAGVISPGKSLLGIMPEEIFRPGDVGVIARSGTLSYEAAAQLVELDIGITTSVGIGGDLINGSSFIDILRLFEADVETKAILLVGEIGGTQEAEAADFIQHEATKPVVAYVAGLSAPKGRKMGHAGAIISAFGESADEKVNLLKKCGATIVRSPSKIGETVAELLSR